jgi:hypothetical protein
MNRDEIIKRVGAMVEEIQRDDLPDLSPLLLSGMVSKLLADHLNDLPERVVNGLFLVAACLMRDHVNAVEKDIQAARDIYKRP